MKMLVTGASGFIGSNFCRYILEKYSDYEIIALDSLSIGSSMLETIKLSENPRFKFVFGSITDKLLIENMMYYEKPDFVINFAAESHVDRSIEGPSIFIDTNILGTHILLEAVKKSKIRRFHQVSTDEVYGDLEVESLESFDEMSPLRPSSPYSASKASADLLCLSYVRTYDLNITISRSSNNYGPNQFYEKLIPVIISNAIKGSKIPVYGTGLNVRDWIFVFDHCSAIDMILHKGESGEIYNVSSGYEKSNLDLILNILNYMNVTDDLVEFVEDRSGHDKKYSVNSNKLRQELGWRPSTDFQDGIKSTLSWYINNDLSIIEIEMIYKKKFLEQISLLNADYHNFSQELKNILADLKIKLLS